MTSQAASILRALFEEQPHPTPHCAGVQVQLPEVVEAELAGLDVMSGGFPVASKHLSECSYCQQAYEELRTLLALEAAGALAKPPAAPAFDFGYLPAPQPAAAAGLARAWRLDALGRLVIQFSAGLLQSLQPPALQPGYLKGATPATFAYAVTGEVEDLNVNILAEPSLRTSDQIDLEVNVDIPSRGGWPHLAGIRVTLRRGAGDGDGDVVADGETDAFGNVVFEGVAANDLPVLSFEIARL